VKYLNEYSRFPEVSSSRGPVRSANHNMATFCGLVLTSHLFHGTYNFHNFMSLYNILIDTVTNNQRTVTEQLTN